ncbi:type II toxin-antitoxin system HicA family toxin [Gemmatimonadota bacterium]
MRIPRDLSAQDLISALKKLGYEVTRQKGGHARLTTIEEGEHHITVPMHKSLRIGTLAGILGDVAEHFHFSREEILRRLFK